MNKQTVKKVTIPNPHDKFFRESLGRREIARDIIKEYMPQQIRKQMDLKTLKISKDSHIDKELADHFSDIIYQVKMAGKSSYVYLLFEHKSYSDAHVFFQLLRNMVKIWEGYLKQNVNAKKLPLIIPLIFYHGRGKWQYGTDFIHLFDVIEGTEKYIPNFTSELLDISHISDSELHGAIQSRILLLAFKYIFKKELIEKLPEIFELFNLLSEKREKTEYLEVLLRYFTSAVPEENEEAFKDTFKKIITKGNTIMTSMAEAWILEGIEKGIAKGREEGREEGIERTAIKMIENDMSNSDIRKITGLSVKKTEALRRKFKK